MITWRWWLMHRIARRWRIPVHFYGWRILVVVSLLLPVLLSSRRPRGVVMAIAALLLLRATEHDRREEVGDAVAVAGGAPAAAVRALADDLGATLLPRPRLRPLVKGKAGPIARSGPPQEGTRDQKKQEAHSQTDAAAGQRQRSPPSLADRAKKPLFMVADHDDAPTRKGSTAPRCDPMRRLSAERTLWRDFWISRFRVVFSFHPLQACEKDPLTCSKVRRAHHGGRQHRSKETWSYDTLTNEWRCDTNHGQRSRRAHSASLSLRRLTWPTARESAVASPPSALRLGILPIWPKIWLIWGPNQLADSQTRPKKKRADDRA